MQKSAGIWMNDQRAYVIENCDGKETLAIIHANIHPRSTTERQNYFQNLAKELRGAQDIFICGPGNMKNYFAKFLMHKPSHDRLNVELDRSLSHPTLNQLRAKTNQYCPKAVMAC